MAGPTPMDHEAADRISAAAGGKPESDAASSGLDDRAQAAADHNDRDDDLSYCDDDDE